MNAIIKELDCINGIGTSFFGDTVKATVNELINILGIKPIVCLNNFKTNFNWTLGYYSEILNKTFVFTIYDYNENWREHIEHIGSASGVNDYLYATKIDWHIGGRSGDDTILVKTWLKNKLNEYDKYK